MSQYTVSYGYPPSREELERWAREALYYEPHEPNPHAPRDSAEAFGWGIPSDRRPPADAVRWVIETFKREVAGVPRHEQLRPEFKFSIVSTCMAHFLWLRTKPGAEWLLGFFGIQEVPPFYPGYAYFYIDPGTGTPVHITKDSGIELRIFRRWERNLNPPIASPNDPTITDMSDRLRQCRDPRASEPMPEASPSMYAWVSERLRDWFLDSPTGSSRRLAGYQWAKNLERKKGVAFYEALNKIEIYKSRAYRLKDRRGGVLWCGPEQMKLVPLPDMYRHQQTMTEHQLENIFRCSSCSKIRPCLPVTRDEKLCCNCYGTIMERDRRSTLDWCTMRECKACPAHLSSQSDLVNLKNRLNRDIEFPVHR